MTIEHINGLPNGSVIETNVCLVGSGAAGLTIAHELDGGPLDVVVFEAEQGIGVGQNDRRVKNVGGRHMYWRRYAIARTVWVMPRGAPSLDLVVRFPKQLLPGFERSRAVTGSVW